LALKLGKYIDSQTINYLKNEVKNEVTIDKHDNFLIQIEKITKTLGTNPYNFLLCSSDIYLRYIFDNPYFHFSDTQMGGIILRQGTLSSRYSIYEDLSGVLDKNELIVGQLYDKNEPLKYNLTMGIYDAISLNINGNNLQGICKKTDILQMDENMYTKVFVK
jgi:hypothetical protein